MKVSFECSNNYNSGYCPKHQSFGAKMPVEDVKLLITSAKDIALFTTDFYKSAARRMTSIRGIPYQDNMVRSNNILSDSFANLYTLLEQVKNFPSSVVKLVKGNGNVFNVVNADNNKILGSASTPMGALDNAFVMRGRYELAPEYWEHKIPSRVFYENMSKNKGITEQTITDFANNM